MLNRVSKWSIGKISGLYILLQRLCGYEDSKVFKRKKYIVVKKYFFLGIG